MGLLIGAVPATLTALGDPNPMRPMIVIGVSALVVVIGLALRHVAPIHVGGATLGILVGAQLFEVIRAFPGWTIFTLIGLAFLAVGAIFERRLRRAGLIDEKPGDAEGHGIPIAQTGDWPGLP